VAALAIVPIQLGCGRGVDPGRGSEGLARQSPKSVADQPDLRDSSSVIVTNVDGQLSSMRPVAATSSRTEPAGRNAGPTSRLSSRWRENGHAGLAGPGRWRCLPRLRDRNRQQVEQACRPRRGRSCRGTPAFRRGGQPAGVAHHPAGGSQRRQPPRDPLRAAAVRPGSADELTVHPDAATGTQRHLGSRGNGRAATASYPAPSGKAGARR
jgi:hypothetical protein